jgi:hypothetical protein
MVHREKAILHHFYTNEMLHFRKVFEMGQNGAPIPKRTGPKPFQRTPFWRAPLQLSAGRIRIRIWSANVQLTYTQGSTPKRSTPKGI